MTEQKRISLREAAQHLGLTESGVRARFRKGELNGERDNTGKIWVLIDPAIKPVVHPIVHPHKDSSYEAMRELVTVLKGQLAILTGERDTYRAAANEQTRKAAEITGLERQVAMLESERDDLRRRLDSEGEERRKLTAILTNQQKPEQPPAPSSEPPREGRLSRAWSILRRKG